MDGQVIISKINEFLFSATNELCDWLNKLLPQTGEDWWQECVFMNLSYNQSLIAEEKHYTELKQFDLAALLRITDKSWYDMRSSSVYLPISQRNCVKEMMKVRNNWAHCSGILPEKESILNDLDTILTFFETVISTNKYTSTITSFKEQIEDYNSKDIPALQTESVVVIDSEPEITLAEIKEKDKVFLTGKPDTKGMVCSVSDVDGTKKYEVFVDGDINTFYEGQIQLIKPESKIKWSDLKTFQSNLTAYEINNPSSGNLYSLNAARIDFVPYQFRPALKLIKSDEPRILIADSVGVGKTIEAGLIIKELEARNELDNVVIICPKPLVAERKWELEMKRFDEEFQSLSGKELDMVLECTHRDGVWPASYNKVIIPYSILDSDVIGEQEPKTKRKHYGLRNLDPAPHFDLVIIDEAHHIRNGSDEKDKAFAYKCVKYFCDHADAVVMLTATPLQTKNEDLYTLLNLLRPDVIIDKDVFNTMLEPNAYIYQSAHIIRGATEGWQKNAISELKALRITQWGENVIARNPLYKDILERLEKDEISREERVKLITDVESLHSFNTMINRTRRKDIQDFCIRRPYTEEVDFTPEQRKLHDSVLAFEYEALSKLHNFCSIPFMMSMIRRQAASCIFGLAPYIRDLINRRFGQIADDPDVDVDSWELQEAEEEELGGLAQHILNLADNLPDEDPKFDSILKIIEEKQKLKNNKLIIFSTFRHTLFYIYERLRKLGYRVARIDGSVRDEERRDLRQRFEEDKEQDSALDILLFTEVGSEGLDYQFCDTMINYDLPWNPMRIEQRIGRIDRRGQKSDYVSIYNIITKNTVDADIYNRCLFRIGIFQNSIGECEEILGEIGSEIEKIATTTGLTQEERCRKLEQIAENEVRKLQELEKFEDEQRSLFGFDLSAHTTAQEIKEAESPWLSTSNLQKLIERYLSDTLGKGQYIVGKDNLKQLRLGKEARLKLLNDYKKMPYTRSSLQRNWESFLKDKNPLHTMTFIPETAEKERNACFMTPMHPLVKQAARHYANASVSYINIEYYSDKLPEGAYPFAIFFWNYIGMSPMSRLVPICNNNEIELELKTILQDAKEVSTEVKIKENIWDDLEKVHISKWQKEKEAYKTMTANIANYKSESVTNSYRNREQLLNNKIKFNTDETILRMYQGELKSIAENYNIKINQIKEKQAQSDILTTRIANGIITIKRG